MDNQDNPSEVEQERSNWTIKAVPVEIRKLALACATKQGVAMHEWLGRAVRNQAKLEAGNRIIPPPCPGFPAGQPVGQQPANQGQAGPIPVIPGELAEVMRAAHAVAEASGLPVPKVAARHAFAVMTTWLRQARGLPTKRRLINGQRFQNVIEGPTNNLEDGP